MSVRQLFWDECVCVVCGAAQSGSFLRILGLTVKIWHDSLLCRHLYVCVQALVASGCARQVVPAREIALSIASRSTWRAR